MKGVRPILGIKSKPPYGSNVALLDETYTRLLGINIFVHLYIHYLLWHGGTMLVDALIT
jgi:hypothetical protein